MLKQRSRRREMSVQTDVAEPCYFDETSPVLSDSPDEGWLCRLPHIPWRKIIGYLSIRDIMAVSNASRSMRNALAHSRFGPPYLRENFKSTYYVDLFSRRFAYREIEMFSDKARENDAFFFNLIPIVLATAVDKLLRDTRMNLAAHCKRLKSAVEKAYRGRYVMGDETQRRILDRAIVAWVYCDLFKARIDTIETGKAFTYTTKYKDALELIFPHHVAWHPHPFHFTFRTFSVMSTADQAMQDRDTFRYLDSLFKRYSLDGASIRIIDSLFRVQPSVKSALQALTRARRYNLLRFCIENQNFDAAFPTGRLPDGTRLDPNLAVHPGFM